MSKIDRNQIACYGKSIDALTRDELITALEELAGAMRCMVVLRRIGSVQK